MRVGRVAAVTSLLLAVTSALADPVPVLSLRVSGGERGFKERQVQSVQRLSSGTKGRAGLPVKS